jgi:UDP-N-acetyl-D-glucosamine dehydrogenase
MRQYPEFEGITSVPWEPARLREYDAAVIVTDHDGVDYAALVAESQLVVDTRNVTRGLPGAADKVVRA